MQCYLCGDEIGSNLGMCENCKRRREASRNPPPPNTKAAARRGGLTPQSTDPTDGLVTVGFWVRVMASFVDSSVMLFISPIIVIILAPLLSVSFSDLVSGWCLSLFGASFPAGRLVAALLSALIALFVPGLIYASLYESSKLMATPGKLLFAIYVCDLNGKKLTFMHAFKRQLAKLLSSLALGIGYLPVAFTQNNQGAHDLVAKTVVVKGSGYSAGRLVIGFGVMVIALSIVKFLVVSNHDTRTKGRQRVTIEYK